MIRELQEIEVADPVPNAPVYLRFSDLPIARTESYANDEVIVDLDERNEVVGIEMLSTELEEMSALLQLARSHQLGLRLLFQPRTGKAA